MVVVVVAVVAVEVLVEVLVDVGIELGGGTDTVSVGVGEVVSVGLTDSVGEGEVVTRFFGVFVRLTKR